ncbi:MAG: lantibiotic ABC transporter permease [Johnsonella sp.]|nr:lantibiotic ABC transporter permease [Johnsonella sp.]
MDIIGRLMLGGDKNPERRNLIWNMLGSAVYAITSMLLGVAAIRILGDEEGGIVFFAFSTLGQQLYIISYFGMRPVQMTDMSWKFSFGDYRAFRLLSAGAAALCLLLYLLLFAKQGSIALIWAAMVGYKIADGFADCYETEYQRQGRLDMTGKSNFLRTIFSAAVFLLTLAFSKNVVFGSLAFLGAGLLSVYAFAIIPLRLLKGVDYRKKKSTLLPLFHLGKWLFLSSFIDIYVFAAAKYAVNSYLGNEANAYFSLIFIPTSIINLMAGFIIRPALTKLSIAYETGEKKRFLRGIKKILFWIIGFTLLGAAGGKILGIRFLALIVGREKEALMAYEGALILLILGGGFYALLNLFYYILVIIKARRAIFIAYSIAAVTAFFLSGYSVRQLGIKGGAIAYLILMLLLSLMFIAVFIKKIFWESVFGKRIERGE